MAELKPILSVSSVHSVVQSEWCEEGTTERAEVTEDGRGESSITVVGLLASTHHYIWGTRSRGHEYGGCRLVSFDRENTGQDECDQDDELGDCE
jgi:hypothetical protein